MKKAKPTKLTKRITTVAAKTKKLAAKVVSAPKAVALRAKKNPLPPAVVEEPIAKRRGSKKLATPVTLAEPDAPHIECRLIVGDLSVQVDPSNLARTLGAGRWGYGLGLVDQWPDSVWVGLLTYLGLPADPLDRVAAEGPVKTLVQQLWYKAIQSGEPWELRVALATSDTERTIALTECAKHASVVAEVNKTYKAEFAGVKEAATNRTERAKKSFGRKGETVYTPTDALKDKKLELGGQQSPLLEFFRVSKFAPATAKQATDGAVKAGLKTAKQTPERVTAFYLSDWAKKGLLIRS